MRKAEAASALENLIKMQVAVGNLEGNPSQMANSMISETWAQSKKHVDWRKTERPHKVALVALALAERIEKSGENDFSTLGYGIALGTVLNTAYRNRDSFNFSRLDDLMLSKAANTQTKEVEKLAGRPIVEELKSILAADKGGNHES